MSSRKKSRDRLIFDWYVKDVLGFSSGPPIQDTGQQVYMKTLIDVAGADGVLSEQ